MTQALYRFSIAGLAATFSETLAASRAPRMRRSVLGLVIGLLVVLANGTPVSASTHCSGGPFDGLGGCATNADCGSCQVAGNPCTSDADCPGQCSTTLSTSCSDNADCPNGEFCDTDSCDAGTCEDIGVCCRQAPQGGGSYLCAPSSTAAECALPGQAGIFNTNVTECDPDPCTNFTGACCVENLSGGVDCSVLDSATCSSNSGVYKGDGTNCDDESICSDLVGACCIPDNAHPFNDPTCAPDVTPTFCSDEQGTHLGISSTCTQDTCALTRGACCIEPQPGLTACEPVTSAHCADIEGTYLGDNTMCDGGPPAPCIPPTGACCVTPASGSIFCEEASEGFCESGGLGGAGVYQGDGTTCDTDPCPAQTGACCTAGNTCNNTTLENCAGFWWGSEQACFPTFNPCLETPVGACCLPDDRGGILFPEVPCGESGGIWLGPNAAVEECDRACCLPDLSCQVISGYQCSAAGGEVSPVGATTCDGFACGTCANVEAPDGGCCKNSVQIDAAKTLCDIPWGVCAGACLGIQSCISSVCDVARTTCINNSVPDCQTCADVGEECELFPTPLGAGPCREPFECQFVDALTSVCGMPNNGNPVSADVCEVAFSPLQCTAANLLEINDPVTGLGVAGTYTEGIGADAGAVVTASVEIGQIYSRDGKYGCYSTTCTGAGFTLAVGISRNIGGFLIDFSGVAGTSYVKCNSADTPIANVGGTICTAYVDAPGKTCDIPLDIENPFNSDCQLVGGTVGGGAGVGLGGGAIVYLTCETTVTEVGTFGNSCVMTPTNPTTGTPICDAGGPYFSNTCGGDAASVTLDATGSIDPDGDTISYFWTSNCANASFSDSSSATPTLQFDGPCNGVCLAQLTVNDSTKSSQCCASVAIADGNPAITCPADTTVGCGADTSTASTGNATAIDSCTDNPSITFEESTTNGCGDTSTITRTFTATDECGLTASCDQTITVADTAPPSITCPDDVTLDCSESTDTSNTGRATATDPCDDHPTFSSSDDVTLNGCVTSGTIVRTWTATDACNQTATCDQTIATVASSCPDGNFDSGEECDDGDLNNSNDCTNACQEAECGDGFIWNYGSGTEQCDDGNILDGDGCDSNCDVEDPVCGDGLGAYGEACDLGDQNGVPGSGCDESCQKTLCFDVTCDDDSPCTRDQCDDSDGTCLSFDSVPQVEGRCRDAGKTVFLVKAPPSNAAGNQVKWVWTKGEATSFTDFGNPAATTSYELCIYDEAGDVPVLAGQLSLPPSESWVSKKDKGWLYKDKTASDDGVLSALLLEGDEDRSRVIVKSKGVNIPMPVPVAGDRYFDQDTTVTVQWENDQGACWVGRYDTAKKNTPKIFKTVTKASP